MLSGWCVAKPAATTCKISPGLSARSPLLAGCMAIFMLSLAGLPPLAGFFGKFYLFSVAFRAGPDHGLALAGRARAFRQSRFALLLSDCAEDDLRRSRSIRSPTGRAEGKRRRVTDHRSHSAKLTISALAALVLLLGVLPQALAARIARLFSLNFCIDSRGRRLQKLGTQRWEVSANSLIGITGTSMRPW